MIQLALKLAELVLNDLKSLGRAIAQGLTGNAVFTSPVVTPAQLDAAVQAVEDQEVVLKTANDECTEQALVLQQRITALESVITQAGADCVSKVSALPDAEAKAALVSAYLPLRSERAPAAPVAIPQNLVLTHGDHSGEADGACNRSKGAKMYRARVGATATGPFEIKYEGTKSSFTISSLAVGDTWFQMAAFGTTGGWSEWCDPARLHVI